MSVLCIVAHPDDEILGVGGTLARHAQQDTDVHVCILSDGVTSRHDSNTETTRKEIKQRRKRAKQACEKIGATISLHNFPDNQFDTVSLLDITQTIESEIDEHNPSTVYTHHYGDLNIDHELTCRATITATRPLADSPVKRVLAFETLSASEWAVPKSNNAFQPTLFVDISDHLQTKIDALSEYERELREPPHPRTKEIVRKNAEIWGSKSGMKASEPFEVLREIKP